MEIKKITCPINGNITLKFQTDAEDSYFDEHVGLGDIEFSHDIIQRSKLRIGIYTLTLKPSIGIDDLQVGNTINFNLVVKEKNEGRWAYNFSIKITDPLPEPEENDDEDNPDKPETKRRPNKPFTRIEKSDPNSKQNQSMIDRPNFKSISKEKDAKKWEGFFGTNDRKGANVEFDSNGRLINIWVNISHPTLLHYQEKNPDLSKKKLVEKYVNFIGFYTWALHLNIQSKKIEYPEGYDPKDLMEATSDALSLLGLGYAEAAR